MKSSAGIFKGSAWQRRYSALSSLLLFCSGYCSSFVHASSFTECDIRAVVSAVAVASADSDKAVVLRVDMSEVESVDTHTPQACASIQLGEQTILLETESVAELLKIPAGSVLMIRYSAYSAMGQDGVVHSETWTIAGS